MVTNQLANRSRLAFTAKKKKKAMKDLKETKICGIEE